MNELNKLIERIIDRVNINLREPAFDVGPYVRDWQDNGVIPNRAKALAVGMMAATLAYLRLGVHLPYWALAAPAGLFAAVSAYILTRPGRAPQSKS